MAANLQVDEAVLAFTLVVIAGVTLKRLGVLREEDSSLFAKLLTKAVLPCVIFRQLVTHPASSHQLWMVLAIAVAGAVSMFAAYGAGRAMRLDRPRIGALMLTSSFGSSALLGYPLIEFAFPNNPEAMTDAVILSELGVGLPIFIFGPAVAMYFGSAEQDEGDRRKLTLAYFKSPIFVAVVLGLALAQLRLDLTRGYLAPINEGLRMMGGALTILACLALALRLKLESMKGIWLLLIVSSLIQMVLQPFIAGLSVHVLPMSSEQKQVLILISTMPSAVLGTVFATHYRCAGETASALIMGHVAIGLFLVPLMYSFLG